MSEHKRYRDYVITKVDETPDEPEHAVVTMDGIEVFCIYFKQDNWPRLIEAAVVASKRTAAWFDKQASAEPAPPPAAPVVTITGEMIYRGAVYLAEWRDIEEWDALDEDSKGGYVSESQDFLEAALRGADLAPEGARDGEV